MSLPDSLPDLRGGVVKARRPADGTLRLRHASKTYHGTRVLNDVSIDVEHGEIHALLGGNGSGKSTLIKLLAGVVDSDPGGEISIDGRESSLDHFTPDDARALGLRFVHQNLGIFDDFSVADNFALAGGFPMRHGRVDKRSLNDEVREVLQRFEIDASPTTPVSKLRPSARTMVAIARALRDDDAKVLVLDEPTASLPDREVELLVSALRARADAGQTILYVSHRLQEVLDLCDRITVLRDGTRLDTIEASDVSQSRVIEMIAGRPVDRLYPERRPSIDREPVLQVRGLSVGPVKDVDLVVGRGEVVGLAGLLGSGRSELLAGLFGDLKPCRGDVELNGINGIAASPADAIGSGLALVPEDRERDAAFLDLSLTDNLSPTVLGDYFTRGLLERKRRKADATSLLSRFGVKSSGVEANLSSLSGGNAQKVILARWLRNDPTLIMLDEPTQGVDVVARADIYEVIRDASDLGTAILLVSSDLDELANLCDRVLVLRDGLITDEISGPELDATRLASLCYASR